MRADDTLTDTSARFDSLSIRDSAAGKKKQMLRAGDLIGVHDPFLGITRPAVVLGVDDEDFGGQHLYRVLVTYDDKTARIEQAPEDFTVPNDAYWGTHHARMMLTRASTPSTQHPAPSTQHPAALRADPAKPVALSTPQTVWLSLNLPGPAPQRPRYFRDT